MRFSQAVVSDGILGYRSFNDLQHEYGSAGGVQAVRCLGVVPEAVGSMTRSTDVQLLVAQAQAGDQTAFRRLIEIYQGRVYGVAFGMLRNGDDAMDVVQDAFVKVHRSLSRFRGSAGFYTWLYRIVVNLCIDRLRKSSREQWSEFDEAMPEGDAASDLSGEDPLQHLDRRRLRAMIDEALEALSPIHRAVILMREVEGLSYAEMAEAMQCSKGTIMSRLFHARRKMQQALADGLNSEQGQAAAAKAAVGR